MPKIEIDADLAARLERAANEQNCSAAELIERWLEHDPVAARTVHPWVDLLAAGRFDSLDEPGRYLAILAWIAANHAAEFSDFVAHQKSGRKYLGLSAEEVRLACRRHDARPIVGSPYWAIMDLPAATRHQFVRRALVFVGVPDEVIAVAMASLATGTAEMRVVA